jgi:hypothetical protein
MGKDGLVVTPEVEVRALLPLDLAAQIIQCHTPHEVSAQLYGGLLRADDLELGFSL